MPRSFQNREIRVNPAFKKAKAGYRYAAYAWLLYRLISGNWVLTLLWQGVKYGTRSFLKHRAAVRALAGRG